MQLNMLIWQVLMAWNYIALTGIFCISLSALSEMKEQMNMAVPWKTDAELSQKSFRKSEAKYRRLSL